MREHLFLCGLTDDQCRPFGEGKRLHVHGPLKNVSLKLENLRVRLIQVEPEALTDLLEIAAYVFRADNSVRRGGPSDPQVGADWRHTFRMLIAVREPDRWSEPTTLKALSQALHFLSDDTWNLEFVENLNPPPVAYYFEGLRQSIVDTSGGTSIVLFSGGLDSFAGAVHELQSTKRHVVLASHRTTPFIGGHQEKLAGVLSKAFPRRVTHVQVDASTSGSEGAREHSQRTRSFLFMAVAAVAADIEGSKDIRIYENGIMSANLPISEQVVGTHASRSTHPRSLLLLNSFLACVPDNPSLDNPFAFDTKIEVVQRLRQSPFGQYIKNTLSCSASRTMTIMHPHCGACKQCIERRVATLGAAAVDPEEAYRIDLFTDPRRAGKDRAMAVDSVRMALDMATISELDFAKRFADQISWLVSAYPKGEAGAVAKKFHSLFQRHGLKVQKIFEDAVAAHKNTIVARTLSPDSLLWLAIDRSGAVLPVTSLPANKLESPGRTETDATLPEDQETEAADVPDEVRLLVDLEGGTFQVQDLPPFSGRSTIRLLSFLVEEYRRDRNADLAPEQHRRFLAKVLADQIEATSEEAVRKLISRLREDFRRGFHVLYDADPEENALIDRSKSGYRLNPLVRVVSFRS